MPRFYSYDRRKTYSYDRRIVADAEDITSFIEGFRRALEVMEKKWVELNATRDDKMTAYRAAVYIPSAFEVLQKLGKAHRIFWGILQQYRISAAADRKLIEQASKEFAKDRIQKPKPEVALEALRKKLDLYRSYLEAADRIIKKGERHSDEAAGTLNTAGCFTLVNAGGFSPQQMADVVKVVEKASSLLKAKGFGKVCYGNIQVTNTVGRSSTVLAFYVIQTDELFVRGNLKGKQGPAVSTVIHELGHRLHRKFLMSKDDQIKSMYQALLKGDEAALKEAMDDKANWPQPGATHEESGKIYEVEKVVLNRNLDYVVQVHLKDAPNVKASISLRSWISVKGLKKETFVSAYARTSDGENFAEMFDHYVEGTLPDGQVQMFEAIVK
jgi:hypothetical protein